MWFTIAFATPKIVGGHDAEPGDWPDVVALYRGDEQVCTGTLITPEWVLSAGHCGPLVDRAVLDTIDRTTGLEHATVEFIQHPDYQSGLDVGLYRLDTPITSVPPRPLALDCLSELVLPETPLTVVGWGYVDQDATVTTTILQQLTIPIADPVCANLDRGCRSAVSPGGELIAGGEGLDSCTGDSGGPGFIDTPKGTVLAATVARAALPSRMICGSGGIYVRADAAADWIEQQIGETLARPDCTGLNRPPQPSAPDIELAQGDSIVIDLDPGDPDAGDTHTVTVLEGPERGSYVDGVFTAEPFQVGATSMLFEVTDDGTPPLSNQLRVPIRVYPAGHLDHDAPPAPGRGCNSVVAPLWAGLIPGCIRRR